VASRIDPEKRTAYLDALEAFLERPAKQVYMWSRSVMGHPEPMRRSQKRPVSSGGLVIGRIFGNTLGVAAVYQAPSLEELLRRLGGFALTVDGVELPGSIPYHHAS